ncbi:hypothetical protein AGMMS50239_32970 [Bacteroidia bacterium]|nr:hypothetical protein AGMMS50239_32970 [Bacteroidia bacterium]
MGTKSNVANARNKINVSTHPEDVNPMNEKIPINDRIRNGATIAISEKLNGIERQYAFEQVIIKGEEVINIHYNFIAYFSREKSDMSLLCRINRLYPVFINDKEPDLVIDELAYETGKVFYPLIIQLNEMGKFASIYNYEEIRDRWTKHRQKMEDYFVGEFVEKYLLLADEMICSQDNLDRIFRRDLFMSIFFFPVYQSYTWQNRKEVGYYFPLAGKAKPVLFKLDEVLSEFLTDNGAIEILHSGNSIDERSYHEMEWGYDEASGEHQPADIIYTGRYTLEEETKLLQTADIKWEIVNGDIPQTIEIKILPLGGIPSGRSLIVEMDDDSSVKKEKGFFRDFWDTLRGKSED